MGQKQDVLMSRKTKQPVATIGFRRIDNGFLFERRALSNAGVPKVFFIRRANVGKF